MGNEVNILVSAKDQASGTLKGVKQQAEQTGSVLGGALKVGALAAAAGLGVAVFAGIKFIQAAAQEEVGIKRLATALDASGGSWAKQGKAIEEAIKQRQKLAFSDNELRDSLSTLIATTGDLDEALRRQKVAMDFSRGANIDLQTASKLLGKVTDENVNVLKRYGINVREGADATEVLALVQQKFSGQSEAFADTAVGKWQRFNNTMGDIKETIGAALLPIALILGDALVAAAEKVQDLAERAKPLIEGLTQRFIDLVEQGIGLARDGAAEFGKKLTEIEQSSTFQAFLDGIKEGLGNIEGVAIVVKDTLIEAFGEVDKVLANLPGLGKLTGGMKDISENKEGIKDVGRLFTEAAAGIIAFSVAATVLDTSINIVGNTLGGLGALIMGIAILPNPFILLLIGVALIAGGLIILETKTGFLSQKLLPALRDLAKTELLPRFKVFVEWVKAEFIPAVERIVQAFLRDWLPSIEKAALAIGTFLLPALDTLHDMWVNLLEPALKATGKALEEVAGWFKRNQEALAILGVALATVVTALILFNAPWLALLAAIILVVARWDDISGFFKNLGSLVSDTVTSIVNAVLGIPIIGDIFRDAFNTVKAIVELVMGLVQVAVELALDTIRNTFAFWKAVFTGDWDAAWQAIKDQAAAIWNALSGIFGLALDAIKSIASSKLEMLKGIGSDLGNAIGDGFNAALGIVEGAATSLANKVIGILNSLIRAINSIPSIHIKNPFGADVNISIPDIPTIPQIGGNGPLSEGTNPGGGQIPAAHGFHGMVSSPTSFLAGEAGRERVDITPVGQAGQVGSFDYDRLAQVLLRALQGLVIQADGREIGRLAMAYGGNATDLLRRGG